MLTSVELKNYGPLADLKWQNHAQINLIVGGNGTGKTFWLYTGSGLTQTRTMWWHF